MVTDHPLSKALHQRARSILFGESGEFHFRDSPAAASFRNEDSLCGSVGSAAGWAQIIVENISGVARNILLKFIKITPSLWRLAPSNVCFTIGIRSDARRAESCLKYSPHLQPGPHHRRQIINRSAASSHTYRSQFNDVIQPGYAPAM